MSDINKDLNILLAASIKLAETTSILSESPSYNILSNHINNINLQLLTVIEDINKLNNCNEIESKKTFDLKKDFIKNTFKDLDRLEII